MQIFKLFYKLMRANWVVILVGFGLLMAITIPINLQFRNALSSEFQVRPSSIAVFNQDPDSPITDHLINYLDGRTDIVPVEDKAEELADAFYNQDISYALTIPQGFGQALIGPQEDYISLEKQVISSQMDEANVDVLLNSYLINARVASANLGDNPSDQDLALFFETMNQNFADSELEILPSKTDEGINNLMAFGSYFTTYSSYILIHTFITVFGYAIISMRNPEIVKRDRLGTLSEGKRFSQSLLGCVSFSLLYWIVLMVTAAFLYGPETLLSESGRLIVLSSLCSTFGIIGLAYFVVTVSKNKGIINFLATFLSLAVAFTSGLFVPRDFIAPAVQQLASIASPIWQVRANEIILSSNNLSSESLQQVLVFLGIQLLIGLAYFAVSFVIQNYRHKNSIYVGVN